MGNDYNGIHMKFALENIFIGKCVYLELFIIGMNIIIAKKAIKSFKKTCRKNDFYRPKILEPAKGKKIQKFKSCNKCNKKDWNQFEVLFFFRS